LVLSLLFISSAYGATTLFVDVNGNDNNSGSVSNPFRTVTKALSCAKSGDTISINNGTYSEKQLMVPVEVNLTSTAKNNSKVKLQPNSSLSSSNPFIFLSSAPGTKGNGSSLFRVGGRGCGPKLMRMIHDGKSKSSFPASK
jgi:hypothetical protein